MDFAHTRSQGAYEKWYSFPEGLGGPFLFRMQRWNPTQKQKLCWWIQDGEANYYVHSGEGTTYISNARLTSANYATAVLPTDSAEFSEFVQKVEGNQSNAAVDQPGLAYERDAQTGFVRRRVDTRFDYLGPFETQYEYGPQDAHLFAAPSGMPVKDLRDEMHRRGWAWFRVAGQLNGLGVAGAGRMPFGYNASRTHPAWLRLNVDGMEVAIDDGQQAAITVPGGDREHYAGKSLLRGLSRPWTGFHTLDSIRRDAAEERLWYATSVIVPDRTFEVAVMGERWGNHYTARYTVDVDRDILESIELWVRPAGGAERYVGVLRFEYLQDAGQPGSEFEDPPKLRASGLDLQPPSLFWVFRLIADVSAGSHT